MKDSEKKAQEHEKASANSARMSAEEAQDVAQGAEQINCQHCGKALPGATRFCLYCGAPTSANAEAVSCPACGAVMPIGTLFCGSCGMSFRASSPVTISGTGTLSFGVPARPLAAQEKRSRVWFGIGIGLMALLFLGVGLVAGRKFLADSPTPSPVLPTPTPNAPSLPQTSSPLDMPARSPAPLPSPSSEGYEKKPSASSPREKPWQPGFYQVIAKEKVPVRRKPQPDGEKFAVVSPQRQVNVVEVQGEWVKIRSGEKVGYIPREAISPHLTQKE